MPAPSPIASEAEARTGSRAASTTLDSAAGPSESSLVRSFRLRLVAIAGAALILGSLLAAGTGLRSVETALNPAVAAMSSTVGRRLAEPLTVALDAGIPFDRLVGVEDFLRSATAFDERIGFAALTDSHGRVVHASGADADQLPAAFEIGAGPDNVLTLSHYIATPIPLLRDDAAGGAAVVGHLIVGVSSRTPAPNFMLLALQVFLSTLALLLLAREIIVAIVHQGVGRPARALAQLGAAVQDGDLSRQAEPPPFGPLRALLEAVRTRLAATNKYYHDLLLAAFAARAGHYEAPVLREIAQVVDAGLSRIRLAPATGATPLGSTDGTASRSALFALLLGEALLLPAWAALPVMAGFEPTLVLMIFAAPLLVGLPLGAIAARRLLAGSADTLAFTSGALIAAAALAGVPAANATVELIMLRVAGGVGLGIAIEALVRRQAVGASLFSVGIVGLGLGLPVLALLGPLGAAITGALVTAGAGVLAGQFLPAREGDEPEPGAGFGRGTVLVCGFAAALAAVIAATGFGAGEPGGLDLAVGTLWAVAVLAGAALLGAAFLGASIVGAGIFGARRPDSRVTTACALATGLLLGSYALLPLLQNVSGVASAPFDPIPIVVAGFALAGAAMLAQTDGRTVEGVALAALVGLAAAGTLAVTAGASAAAGLAAILCAGAALIGRPS